MKNNKVGKYTAFFAVIFSLFFSYKVQALTLTPLRFEINGDKGQMLSQEITLINEKKTTETLYTSFANFEAQGETGTPAFVTPKNDIGTWITAPSQVTLSAGESKTINFTVTIPSTAESGGHFGAIFFGTSNDSNSAGKVSIGAKTGALILLSVNGPVKEAGGLLSFNTIGRKFFYNTLPVSFEYRFRNDGSDRVKPAGKVIIRNTLFIRADKLNANSVEGNILPKSTRRFEFDWIKNDYQIKKTSSVIGGFFQKALFQWKNFALGIYSAHINISYGTTETHTVKKTTWFFVFPWQLLIILFVLISTMIFFGKKGLRRYNQYVIKKAQSVLINQNNRASNE